MAAKEIFRYNSPVHSWKQPSNIQVRANQITHLHNV
jgi:hypothetical protein